MVQFKRRNEAEIKKRQRRTKTFLQSFRSRIPSERELGRRLFDRLYKEGMLAVQAFGDDDSNDLIAAVLLDELDKADVEL